MSDQPSVIGYTRNGFSGPFTILQKPVYPVEYHSAEGSYVPRVFGLHALSSDMFDPARPMPIPLLQEAGSTRLSIEAFNLSGDMPFGLRNVFADELHVVYSGSAVFETEAGRLEVGKDDVLLIPRSVSYRIVGARDDYKSMIAASETRWTLAMTPGRGTLQRAYFPEPCAPAAPQSDRYELVLRHGNETTSLFYDGDPVGGQQLGGETSVIKINMKEVGTFELVNGAGMVPPDALFNDASTCNLVFNLSSRKTRRPGIHYNADYDEMGFYLGGASNFGAITHPGTLTHCPKGFPHQGPEEDTPGGHTAILIESRCRLEPTPIALALGKMVIANEFEVHPSELATV